MPRHHDVIDLKKRMKAGYLEESHSLLETYPIKPLMTYYGHKPQIEYYLHLANGDLQDGDHRGGRIHALLSIVETAMRDIVLPEDMLSTVVVRRDIEEDDQFLVYLNAVPKKRIVHGETPTGKQASLRIWCFNHRTEMTDLRNAEVLTWRDVAASTARDCPINGKVYHKVIDNLSDLIHMRDGKSLIHDGLYVAMIPNTPESCIVFMMAGDQSFKYLERY